MILVKLVKTPMQDILELNEFFVEGGNQERSHVLLHITEPDTAEEKTKGYFFAVAEINNGSVEQIEYLQKMIDELESGYYETKDETDKNSFEIVLEFINRRGHHLLQYQNSVINCLVGVLRGHELFFAYHGRPQAVLFYNGENEELNELNTLEDQTEVHPGQLFSSLMQGEINPGDYFLINTPHVDDYFSLDRIKKILSSRTTKQTADHLQKVLSDLRNNLSFGGIIFHFPTAKNLPKSGQQPKVLGADSQSSINNLLSQEKTTADTLSPPLLGGLNKKITDWKTHRQELITHKKQSKLIEKVKQETRDTNYRPASKEEKKPLFGTILIALGKTIVTLFTYLFLFIKNTFVYLGKGTVALILLITNKDNKRSEVIKILRNFFYTKLEYLGSLPLISKIILTCTIVFGIIFVGSLVFLKLQTTHQVTVNKYNQQLQAVIDKKNAADASLLYNDETKAQTLLQEAKSIIIELQKNIPNKETEKQITELNSGIEENLQKVRKLTVAKPELLADLTVTNKEVQINKLAILDKQLMVFGNSDPLLYLVNTETKKVETKDHAPVSNLRLSSTPKENDIVIFITGDSAVAEFNKVSKLTNQKDITYPYNNPKISAIFVYSRKLYLIDSNNNKIYKHSPTQTGYDKGQDWLKDSSLDLKNTVSLAVDGDLFVLKENGEVIKLAGGLRQDFSIQNLDPKLDKPTQIWTYNGVNNLYILEATNKRVIITDKTGKLLKQITALEWQNPTSMIVDETKKTIYILDNNKIYKINF